MTNNLQTKTLSLQAAYIFGIENGLQDEIQTIKDMEIEWDRSFTSSVRRGYIVDLFERNDIFESFKEQHWANGNSPSGETMKRRFLRYKQEYEDYLSGDGIQDDIPEIQDLADQAFAAESDLRDFLARNLNLIEPGLSLFEHNGKTGVEFYIEGGRIDLLTQDSNGHYVVIELKLSRGHEKTLGQILYYMAWVDKNLGNAPSRGVIIAREIPNTIILAVNRAENISLFEYELSVSLQRIV